MADTEPATAATIAIDGFTYERVTTDRHDHYSSGDHRDTHVVQEIVVATFAITDAEPEARSALVAWRYVPKEMRLKFESTGCGEWTADIRRCFITGKNVRKDGGEGSESTAHWYDWPEWARALVEPDADGHSVALDWLHSQYPRQAA